MKRILIVAIFILSVSSLIAQTDVKVDTIVRDLDELEKRMNSENIRPQNNDTIYYGINRQKNFNALIYSLDKRHRYIGDKWRNRGVFDHTYMEFGAGTLIYSNEGESYLTPQTNLHLNIGKDLSPLHSLRVGIGGEMGYVRGYTNPNLTTRINLDYLFNFSNYLIGYRPDRFFNVLGIIGIGTQYSYLKGVDRFGTPQNILDKSTSFNIHTGFQFKLLAGTHASVSLEPYILAGSEGIDLSAVRKFNHFGIGYGVNLSYIWYFFNNMTSEHDVGDFKRTLNNDKRLFFEDTKKYTWRRPWFFNYSIGQVRYNRMPIDLKETSGITINAALGQWLSSAIAVRTGLSITNSPWTKAKNTKSFLGSAGAFVDAIINPFGFIHRFNWNKSVGLNLSAGYEFGKILLVNPDLSERISGNYLGYRFGGEIWAKLTNDLRIGFEPKYIFVEHFDRTDKCRVPYDRLELKLALSILFRNYAQRKIDNKQISVTPISPQKRYYIGLGLGWNTPIMKWQYKGNNRNSILNGNLFFGYNIDAINSLKVMADYITNPILEEATNNSYKKNIYKSTFISADYQLALLNLMIGYNPMRKWDANIYFGPSISFRNNYAPMQVGANFGGIVTYRVLPRLSLYYSHTIYWTPPSTYDIPNLYNTPGVVTNVLTLGAIYNLDRVIKFVKDLPWTNNRLITNQLFLDYGYGYAIYDGLPIKTIKSLGSSMHFSFGYWFNTFLGGRIGINMAKGTDLSTEAFDGKRRETLCHGLGMATLSLDGLLNPLGISRKYNMNSNVGLNFILGYQRGLLVLNDAYHTVKGSKQVVDGIRIGSQLWFKMNRDLRFTLESVFSPLSAHNVYVSPNRTMFSDSKEVAYKPLVLGNSISLRLGIEVLLKSGIKETTNSNNIINNIPQSNKRFFISFGGGWNIILLKHSMKNSSSNINTSLFAGYRFNHTSAIRFAINYVNDNIKYGYTFNKLSEFIELKQRIAFLSLAFQIDPISYIQGINNNRAWKFNIYGGPAIGFKIDKERIKGGALNFGITLERKINTRVSAFFNHDAYILSSSSGNELIPGTSLTGTITALNAINIGLTYNL